MDIYNIRAEFDDKTFTVYQAFDDSIANIAIQQQKLLPPFSYQRLTWIKPSLLWLMYRSDWGRQAGMNCILKIKIHRKYWDQALAEAILTTPEKHVYKDAKKWRSALNKSRIRVQWDPERDLYNTKLKYKSIQVGITSALAEEYAKKWIDSIEDVTPLVRQMESYILQQKFEKAQTLMPLESIYPVSNQIKTALGMSQF